LNGERKEMKFVTKSFKVRVYPNLFLQDAFWDNFGIIGSYSMSYLAIISLFMDVWLIIQ